MPKAEVKIAPSEVKIVLNLQQESGELEDKMTSLANLRCCSLFEVSRRRITTGSSMLSQMCEPHRDETTIHGAPKVQYENSFRMEPDCKFPPSKVERVMRGILKENLTDKTYNPMGCAFMSKMMSQEIRNQVREMDLKRYKIIAIVTIGEKNDQGVRIGSRCVWDKARDNFATAQFESPHLFATATCYAVYHE